MNRITLASFLTAILSAAAGALWIALGPAVLDDRLLSAGPDLGLVGGVAMGLFIVSLTSGFAALLSDSSCAHEADAPSTWRMRGLPPRIELRERAVWLHALSPDRQAALF